MMYVDLNTGVVFDTFDDAFDEFISCGGDPYCFNECLISVDEFLQRR